MTIDVWHNLLWSKYKAAIFSELNSLAIEHEVEIDFFQIFETDKLRSVLSPVRYHDHRYPYTLIFPGIGTQAPRLKVLLCLARHTALSRADLVVLAGYDRIEYWMQLLICKLRKQKIGVFCDSDGQRKSADYLEDLFEEYLLPLLLHHFLLRATQR